MALPFDNKKKIALHQDAVLRGVINGIIAFFFLAVMGMFVKLLGPRHHIVEISFYRNLIPMILILGYILISGKKEHFHTDKPGMLALRALIGTLGLFLTFATMETVPLSNATVLFFASTLLVPVLSFFILKEHIGPHRWAAVFIGMCGVMLIAQPDAHMPVIGIVYGLGAAFMQGLVQVFLRHLRTEHPLTITFYFMLGGTLISALMMPWIAVIPTPHDMLLFLGVGISGGLAQYYLTSAFKYAPASVVSPFNYTGLIWASVFDIMIWHYVPGWPVFAGAGIIILSKLYIIHRERLAEKRKRAQAY